MASGDKDTEERIATIRWRLGHANPATVYRDDIEYLLNAYTQAQARADALQAAILDIDAHARGVNEDAEGFVTDGYLVTVGSLHRALGLVGHTAPLCPSCPHPHETEALSRMAVENVTLATQLADKDKKIDAAVGELVRVTALWSDERAAARRLAETLRGYQPSGGVQDPALAIYDALRATERANTEKGGTDGVG